MKQYFAKVFDGDIRHLESLAIVELNESQLYVENSEDEPKKVLTIPESKEYSRIYKLLDSLPKKDGNPAEVVGYLAVSKKNSAKIKAIKTPCGYLPGPFAWVIDNEQNGHIIGYVQTKEPDKFIAVTVERFFFLLPLVFAGFLLLLVGMLIVGNGWLKLPGDSLEPGNRVSSDIQSSSSPMEFGNPDDIEDGEITDPQQAPLDPLYFNIKCNATPILENGKMNIRIENSDRNILNCSAVITINVDGEEKIIYTTPLMKPQQYVKDATIKEMIPEGEYSGSAHFYFFDDDEGQHKVGESAVELIINVQ